MLDVANIIGIGLAAYRFAQRRIKVIGSSAWPIAEGRIFNSSLRPDELLGWAVELT